MSTGTETTSAGAAARRFLDEIAAARDAIGVSRVFGEPYVADGATIIPVAHVTGGFGGGGGEGGNDEGTGSGAGGGFGLRARPVGVYEVRDGSVEWRPALDATRIVTGFQVLVGLLIVGVSLARRRGGGRGAGRGRRAPGSMPAR